MILKYESTSPETADIKRHTVTLIGICMELYIGKDSNYHRIFITGAYIDIYDSGVIYNEDYIQQLEYKMLRILKQAYYDL